MANLLSAAGAAVLHVDDRVCKTCARELVQDFLITHRPEFYILDGFPRTKAEVDWLCEREPPGETVVFILGGLHRGPRCSPIIAGADAADYAPVYGECRDRGIMVVEVSTTDGAL